jgi:DNA-binding HxlR family transcriptional regulator
MPGDNPNVYARDCPSRVVMNRISDRWTALIVGVLEKGPVRFTEIRDAIGITPKVLTETLRALEGDGLVARIAYPEVPPRVEYELTPLGETLSEPLAAIRDWAEEHLDEVITARERQNGGEASTDAGHESPAPPGYRSQPKHPLRTEDEHEDPKGAPGA